jgi:hypothetical protein
MAIKYLDAKRLQGTNAERLALTTGLPDYEEDFDTDPTSGDWTLTGSAIAYDSSAKNITLDAVGTYNADPPDGLRLDLQDILGGNNLDNTEFIVQFVWKATSWTEETSSSAYHDIGFWLQQSENPTTGTKNTFLAFAGGDTGSTPTYYQTDYCMKIADDASYDGFFLDDKSGSPDNPDKECATFGIAPSTGTTVGVRMIRTGTSAMKGEIYTDADFTSTPTTATLTDTAILAVVDDLRYIYIAGYVQAGGSAVNQATLDNLKIWNGTTSTTAVYPDLPNGTIFNETDTYKYFMWNGTDTWNQMVSS